MDTTIKVKDLIKILLELDQEKDIYVSPTWMEIQGKVIYDEYFKGYVIT